MNASRSPQSVSRLAFASGPAWVARLRVSLLCLVTLGALAASPSLAHAEDDVLAGSPVVRRNLQYRAARHEVAGLVGFTVGDPYVRSILPGARYDYHLYDWLSVGARLQAGVPVLSATYEEVETKVTRNNDTFVMEGTSLRFLGLGHVSISPLIGKMLAFSSVPIQFDVHVDLLGGIVNVASTGDALATGTGLSLGAAVGYRVFISDVLALTMDLQGISANRALSVNRDSKETGRKVRFNTVVNIGVAFFMPPKLRRAD